MIWYIIASLRMFDVLWWQTFKQSQRLATTNVTSESILISILYLIGLIAWPKSDRKRGRGRPFVYLSTSCNTEMFVVRIWLRLDSNRALHDFLAMDYYPYNRKIMKACRLTSLPDRYKDIWQKAFDNICRHQRKDRCYGGVVCQGKIHWSLHCCNR